MPIGKGSTMRGLCHRGVTEASRGGGPGKRWNEETRHASTLRKARPVSPPGHDARLVELIAELPRSAIQGPLARAVILRRLRGLLPGTSWACIATSGAFLFTSCGCRMPRPVLPRSSVTDGAFDDSNPEISHPTAGGYGPGGAHQYDRLAEAIGCDRDAKDRLGVPAQAARCRAVVGVPDPYHVIF